MRVEAIRGFLTELPGLIKAMQVEHLSDCSAYYTYVSAL